MQVIKPLASAKPWSAAARSTVTEAVDTEAAAVVIPAEDVHSIGHVAPYRCVPTADCGAPFHSGTADSSDWPDESVAQNQITILALQKWSWPLGRNLYT